MKIFLTGATGFVGRHMLERLLADGHAVRAALRGLPGQKARVVARSQHLGRKDDFQWVQGDVVEGSGLDQGMQGCDAVIHLVGIIVEKGNNTFERVHHLGTRNVVEAAKRSGIKRFVQMSALGVRANGVALYQTTKWKGEEEVRRSGIPFCILRPSLIFGEGDGFVTQMMETMRSAPLFRPVPGDGKPKFRPIFIDDVTACFVRALTAEAATNQTVELGGADELTLNEVLAEIARCAGVRKPAIHIPLPVMFAGAAVMQKLLKNPPVTTEQLRMLREGSTCDIGPMKSIFGVDPRGFKGCGRS
ncbi:MAG TPA: complex I NDUFA9 subunit family protein [Candidatus Angelobacter sp.]|jgi:NADH dehydrogenase|nr:complex I NDUFA9 subunit family protein [Candidatus Angelobacter sp.]